MAALLALVRAQVFLFPSLNRGMVRMYGRVKVRGAKRNLVIGKRVVFLGDATLIAGWDSAEDRISIGDNVVIEDSAYINAHGGVINVGAQAFIGVGAVVQGKGGVNIGRDSMLGPYVQIYSSDHSTDRSKGPYRTLPEVSSPVEVGENVWVGASSIILRGSVIAPDSIVAAASVVRMKVEKSGLIAAPAGMATIRRTFSPLNEKLK
jgi:acetyltransferase-like isoleucine patch superfamily enzyme